MPPLVSKRIAAGVRKRAIIDGTFGSWDDTRGGWIPEWDIPRKMFMARPLKGHKNERTRAARADKITKALEGMDEKIAAHKLERKAQKPTKDLLYRFKKVAERKGSAGPI